MKFSTIFKISPHWAFRFLKKRAGHLASFIVARARGRRTYRVEIESISIDLCFFSPYHHARAEAMANGTWEEYPLLPMWIAKARESTLTFDVGGYNGIYGLLAARSNPDGTVYIFEPDLESFRHITRNVELNRLQNVHVVGKAVSDTDGTVMFAGDGSTGSRIATWGTPVPSVRLASFGSPDLLKVDVEGHETEVLRGADLLRTRTLFIEVNTPATKAFLTRYREVYASGLNHVYMLAP